MMMMTDTTRTRNLLKKAFAIYIDLTVETYLSAVHLCIKSAMLTSIVPRTGVAGTNFFSRLTT